MPSVKLKGVNQVSTRLASGKHVTYYYAWKGGPRLAGRPGSPEFMAAYHAAIADRSAPRADTLAGLVALYKSKPEFQTLADSTRSEWTRWLDRIAKHDVGSLTCRALEDRRVRADLIDWRDEYADRPRTADYGMQVLSRVLTFAADRGLIKANHAAGVSHLYAANRADQIWTEADLKAFSKHASVPVMQAVRLACLTGLRRGDLIKLRWGQIGDLVIEKATAKSRGSQVAVIPLLAETKALLEAIGKGDADQHVLLNSRKQPWTGNGLTHLVVDATKLAKVKKTLHDARGTFATRLRLAGLERDQIADIMGWKKDRVDRILTRYVDQATVITAMVEKLRENERKTKTSQTPPKYVRIRTK